ncbi:MAG: hypothetical protein J6A15_03930 [Clostridia bacterium]|nr:hypothetical protein [Clostridia bacterium]
MKKTSNILWGLVFIVLGIIWGINALGIANINIFFKGWWTLFIIVPSIIEIVKKPKDVGNYVALLIGVALLLAARDIISFGFILKLIFPVILVGIGVSIIFKDTINSKLTKKIQEITPDGTEIYAATFSENKVRLEGNEFKNANLDATFGSVDFDISNCDITEDRVIKASAIFASIDIRVPRDVNVKVKSTGIFGGTSNKVRNTNTKGRPTIYIDSLALFGGVEIE